jgi:hypothetical protein
MSDINARFQHELAGALRADKAAEAARAVEDEAEARSILRDVEDADREVKRLQRLFGVAFLVLLGAFLVVGFVGPVRDLVPAAVHSWVLFALLIPTMIAAYKVLRFVGEFDRGGRHYAWRRHQLRRALKLGISPCDEQMLALDPRMTL